MNCKSAFFTTLIVLVGTIIALVYVSLGWSEVSYMTKDELKEEYFPKDEIGFYDLPEDIQSLYIYKSDIPKPQTKVVTKVDTEAIQSLEEQNKQLHEELFNLDVELDKADRQIKNKNKEIQRLETTITNLKTEFAKQEEQVEKTVKTEETKENYALYKDEVVQTLRCSNFAQNQYHLTKECEKKLDHFLDSYDKPAHFEMISMVSKNDFKKVKSNLQDQSVKNLIDEGLSKLRAKEVGWYIRQRAKPRSFYSFPPYTLSTDETSGVVINIY